MDYDEFLSTFAYSRFLDMSASSIALCLSALTVISDRYQWCRNDVDLNDTEWELIDSYIGLANKELMTSLVGVILPHAMSTISAFKMLPCDGGVYLRDDYPLLYDALDAVYIVSGTQFRVPDMRDRVPVGTDNNYALDDAGGADSVTLTVDQIPPHTHTTDYPSQGVDLEAPGAPDILAVGNPPIKLYQSGSTGGGNSHENRMPYRAVKFAIIAG